MIKLSLSIMLGVLSIYSIAAETKYNWPKHLRTDSNSFGYDNDNKNNNQPHDIYNNNESVKKIPVHFSNHNLLNNGKDNLEKNSMDLHSNILNFGKAFPSVHNRPSNKPFTVAPSTTKEAPPLTNTYKNIAVPESYQKIGDDDQQLSIVFHPYDAPWTNELAVAFIYYNPSNSKRVLMNYLFTVEKMKVAGIPSFTLELVYGDTPEIDDAYHLKGKSIIYQKEHLCSLLEKEIPDSYSKILFLDADVVFEMPDWYNEVSTLLDAYEIVQPFTFARWTDATYSTIINEKLSVLYQDTQQPLDVKKYDTGHGWGFQRSWFKKFGFYDYAVTGCGSLLSVSAWMNLKVDDTLESRYTAYFPSFMDYYQSLDGPTMTCARGAIYHLFHGPSINNDGAEIYHILDGVTDIRQILKENGDGVLHLLKHDVEMKIAEHFMDKHEDDVVVPSGSKTSSFLFPHYTSPIKKDLAIGLVYFNPTHSKRMLMNYLYVVERMKVADIPYFTIELHEHGSSAEIDDAYHVSGIDVVNFQKENLCALLEEEIPDIFSKVMFVDNDVVFDRPNWYNEVSKSLDTYQVIQPFTKAQWLDVSYSQVLEEKSSIVYQPRDAPVDETKYNAGLAWGFQRSWFREIGYYPFAITGGGDILSAAAWLHLDLLENEIYSHPSFHESFNDLLDSTAPSVSCSKGIVYHLYHGCKGNRVPHTSILDKVHDVRDIIKENNEGVFIVTDPKVQKILNHHFEERNDDGFC